ncbi:hypothetical protein N8584_02445 [bacterium]|nr:hypothetical protein [bacterium]MDA7679791.1 hypothetical protein [bacterium]
MSYISILAQEISYEKIIGPSSVRITEEQLGEIELKEGEELSFDRCVIKVLSLNTRDVNNSGSSLRPLLVLNKEPSPRIVIKTKYPLSEDYYLHAIGTSTSNGSTWNWQNKSIGAGIKSLPITGPAKVKISINPQTMWSVLSNGNNVDRHTPKQSVSLYFQKNIIGTSGSQGLKNNVLVIPEGLEGVNLILESSIDLINWQVDVLGIKLKSDSPKFYRLRAKKK